MKKFLLIIVLAATLILCAGCEVTPQEGQLNRGHLERPFGITNYPYEWVSPEGVHYWCLTNKMAPRYDHNGNLVIDE